MSKRKRPPKNPADPEGAGATSDEAPDQEESGAQEAMAHVSPDFLAASPEVFAGQPAEPSEPPLEPVVPPVEAVSPEASPTPAEATAEAVPAPAEAAAQPAPVTAPPAPTPAAAARPAGRRSSGPTVAFGVVLVVVGIFALGIVVFGVDLTQYGWPLFVIIPGLTLLVVGFFGAGQGASIVGGLLTMLGLVLAYQSAYGDWASWAFVWALVAPGGVGLGMYLQALRDRDAAALRRGRTLIFIGLVIFMIGFVFFESILGISGMDYGLFGKAALPLLLVAGGVILLVRNAQRNRKT